MWQNSLNLVTLYLHGSVLLEILLEETRRLHIGAHSGEHDTWMGSRMEGSLLKVTQKSQRKTTEGQTKATEGQRNTTEGKTKATEGQIWLTEIVLVIVEDRFTGNFDQRT